jgi:hypothetical protein
VGLYSRNTTLMMVTVLYLSSCHAGQRWYCCFRKHARFSLCGFAGL